MKRIILSILLVTGLILSAESKLVTELTDANFNKEVVQNGQVVLVDFWAPWCGPCKMLGPIIEELAAEYKDEVKFTKLNVDNNPQTAGTFGIRSIPTVGMFINGKPVDGFVGLRNKEEIKEMIARNLMSLKEKEDVKEKIPE